MQSFFVAVAFDARSFATGIVSLGWESFLAWAASMLEAPDLGVTFPSLGLEPLLTLEERAACDLRFLTSFAPIFGSSPT
jgi:hypothetical protein